MLENQIIHYLGMENMTMHVDSQVRTTFSREERDSTLESQPGASRNQTFHLETQWGDNLQFVPIYCVWKTWYAVVIIAFVFVLVPPTLKYLFF